MEATARLAGRIGARVADRAQSAWLRGDVTAAVAALLPYYDAAYAHQLQASPGHALATIDVGAKDPRADRRRLPRDGPHRTRLTTKSSSARVFAGTWWRDG